MDADASGRLPRVTIVTPVYNEEATLYEYRDAVSRSLLSSTDVQFEILFVDDGSTDHSWTIIEEFCTASPSFRGIRLSRNFGPHTADKAGIDHATGDAIVTLACDLQDPPEVILEFVEKWKAGAQIVWGTRRSRPEGPLRIALTKLFSWLLRTQAMPKGSKFSTGGFFLIDQRVAECFRELREHNRISFALVAWTGFRQEVALYDRRARTAGVSSWKIGNVVKTMYDALLGFSNVLPRFITLLGAAIFLMNIPIAIFLVVDYVFSRPFPGWTGLMVTLFFFFGIVCLMLGIMSEYLHRIYIETTGRPLYFVAQESTKSVTIVQGTER
jgi:glycosyltransferase involved in cell wall biosynthesis